MQFHTVENYKLDSLFSTTKKAILGAIAVGLNDQRGSRTGCVGEQPVRGRRIMCGPGYSYTSKNAEYQVLEATAADPRSIKGVQEFAITARIDPAIGFGHMDTEIQQFMYAVHLDVAAPYCGDIVHISFYGRDNVLGNNLEQTEARWILTMCNLELSSLDNPANAWVLDEYLRLLPEVVLSDLEVRQGLLKLRLKTQENRSWSGVSTTMLDAIPE